METRHDVLEARPYRLHNPIQPYAWGERGPRAFIPRLLGEDAPPDAPAAELWVGAHPSAPSRLDLDGRWIPLNQAIARWPRALLGSSVQRAFGDHLPFLFKILSAAEPLSIQAHPNKAQAQVLHARDPEHYPDAHHKPEIAIALESLQALAGFKPLGQWKETLRVHPQLQALVGDLDGTEPPLPEDEAIRRAFTRLLQTARQRPDLLSRTTDALAQRFSTRPNRDEFQDLYLFLYEKYGKTDVGLLVLFFLNQVELKAGQAIYLDAGLPHAYLKGNIAECMANSDNVVRLGLTTKFKDVDALLEILRFQPGAPPIFTPDPASPRTVYGVPCPDFEIHRLRLGKGCQEVLSRPGGPEVLFVVQGVGEIFWDALGKTGRLDYRRGQGFFVPAVLPAYRLRADAATDVFLVRVPLDHAA
ncbi:mannose-6-phosphate isomerase, type 1 [Desulfacinum hydrothermale DSM 13146]|uniref:mannose-6-phosphate isomerase n=1 Tax=Desulfacinum hydrothermale DSM 13146 TaxID=1121390 RepID=A0A1W1WZQ9_9BACT|nr:mannose-6-phosphate isomerase, class I [Desulfacinum hydrothermale]SMC17135.1 mannose-6-phosphate isomerase, type 1 [Desulfacinum hydrothermale DSM 13146]